VRTWYEFKASDDGKKETQLYLYNEIGGFGKNASDFVRDLQTVPQDNRVVLRIHSPGGDVLDGHAIFNALRAHPGGLTTQIDGLAASMASVVALAGDPVRMAGNGLMMIHNVSAGMHGDSEDLRQMADVMDKIQETIKAIYSAKTGLSKKKIQEMMDAETWMTAKEAVDLGFADEITGDLKMAAKFDLSKFKNPPALLTPAAAAMDPNELPSKEESKKIFRKVAAFFVSNELEAANKRIIELEGVIAKNDEATEELVTAHTTASFAKDEEIKTLTQNATDAKAMADAATADFENKVSAEVVKRCAAIGITEPIKRDPAVNTDEDLQTVREQMLACEDPKEKAALARKARALRSKARA